MIADRTYDVPGREPHRFVDMRSRVSRPRTRFPQVTVDLAGTILGPWPTAARYVVINLDSATADAQPSGTVRPSVIPQNEVWIDLPYTTGRVYLSRVG